MPFTPYNTSTGSTGFKPYNQSPQPEPTQQPQNKSIFSFPNNQNEGKFGGTASFLDKVFGPLSQGLIGGAKELGKTILNTGNLGAQGLDKLFPTATSDQRNQEVKSISNNILNPTNTAQRVGAFVEPIAELLIPTGAMLKGQKALTVATENLPKLARVLTNLGVRSATEATLLGGQSIAKEGGITDKSKESALIGAIFPVLGTVTKGILGGPIKTTGETLLNRIIKPSVADVKNGFKIDTISKYDLGGPLKTILEKTATKMNALSDELNTLNKNSKEALDLMSVYQSTAKRLGDVKSKFLNFGNNSAVERVLKNLQQEIIDIAPNGIVDLSQGTLIKRGAGTKGAWVFGNADPDATAVEKVYNTFYNEIKKALENLGGPEIKKINSQLSELIPVQNAVLRRIPVAERNNAIGLMDGLTLAGSLFNPQLLALFATNRLSKSASVASGLLKLGEKISAPASSLGQRLFGR